MQVLYEGVPVVTLREGMPQAEAFVAEGGVIRAVGARKELRAAFPNARRVGLEGAAVVPAFNDCHCHILWLGLDLVKADLKDCRSIPQLLNTVRDWAAAHPEHAWIRGRGYDQNRFAEGRHVTRGELDSACPDRPVYLDFVSKHGAAVNTAALRQAGVTSGTPDPPGGEIVRDEHGEPTGILLENAMQLVSRHFPAQTVDELAHAVDQAARFMADRGILAASDAVVGSIDLELEWKAFALAMERGAPLRITLMPAYDAAAKAGWFDGESRAGIEAWIRREWGIEPRDNLRLGPIKLWTDGSLTGRTAALHEPFIDTNTTGLLLMEPEDLVERIRKIHRSGFQCAAHAIGDRAVEGVLHGYRAALTESPRPDARHRIEHCMVVNDGIIQSMRELDVLAVAQPEFFRALGHAYRKGLGARADRMMPYRTWLKAGIRTALSSDQPIVSGDPIVGWRAAVTRAGEDGTLFGPEEGLDPLTALRCYTVESAHAGFDEAVGMLAPGKRADFVVLSHAPERVAEEDMKVVAVSHALG